MCRLFLTYLPGCIRLSWVLRLVPLLAAMGAAGVCLPAYFQADDFGFIRWLRYDVSSPLDFFIVWKTGMWRPFHFAVLWLQANYFGPAAAGYHAVQGLLYLITVLLFQEFCAWLVSSRRLAALAALLFAVSYSHWEAVLWISASSELLVGIFGLSLWLSLRNAYFRMSPAWGWMAVGFHLLALLTKENAIVLFPLTILLAVSVRQFPKTNSLWIAMAASWAALLGLRGWFAASGDAVQSGIFGLWGIHPFHNLSAYLIRLFAPGVSNPSPMASLIAVVAGLALFTFFVYLKNKGLIGMSIWTIVALAPYLGVNTPGYYPSRYTFLAGMGWALGVVYLIEWIGFHALNWKKILVAGCLIWASVNAFFYIGHSEIHYFLRMDTDHRQIVNAFKELNLPPINRVAVLGLKAPMQDQIPETLYDLYTLAYPPPQVLWISREQWTEDPDIILQWENNAFTIVKLPKM